MLKLTQKLAGGLAALPDLLPRPAGHDQVEYPDLDSSQESRRVPGRAPFPSSFVSFSFEPHPREQC